jgi:hypothetical protein
LFPPLLHFSSYNIFPTFSSDYRLESICRQLVPEVVPEVVPDLHGALYKGIFTDICSLLSALNFLIMIVLLREHGWPL